MLIVSELSKSFQTKGSLFLSLSFSLEQGHCLRVVGRNGVGKTTLLKCLAGFLIPDHGELKLDGRSLTPSDAAFSPAHERSFFPKLTLKENFQFFREFYGTECDIEYWVNELGLETFINQPFQKCSSGIRKRSNILRSIIKDSPLLLLDEPLANLDPLAKEKLIRMFEDNLFFRSKIIILSTNEDFQSNNFQTLELNPLVANEL